MTTILSKVMQAAVIVLFCLNLIFDLPMQQYWVFLSAASLLAHIALIRVARHTYGELSFEMLMKVVRLDLFEARKDFDDWLYTKYDFTSSGAFSSVFYSMGYLSRNTASNIGPVNYLLIFFLVSIALQILFWPKTCVFFSCSRPCALRIKKLQP